MAHSSSDDNGDETSRLYQPLNRTTREIRILCFDNSDDGDTTLLRFHLETISLVDGEDLPFYEAISYTWGTSTERETIQVNDRPMSVPINTERALRCIALGHGHRRVFVDAVCINQADLRERGSQVALMGHVYSKARAVLIWLGDAHGPDYDLPAFTRLVDLYEKLENSPDHDERARSRIMSNIGTRYPFAPLYRVYEAEWFSRTWIIQELVLARDAICFHAAHAVPWAHVSGPAVWMSRFQRHPYDRDPPSAKAMEGINNAVRLGVVLKRETSAENLFAFARSFDCRDPRDKLFALLGLAIHENWDLGSLADVVPDYEESVPATYVKATRACIEQSRSLGFLHWAGPGMPFHGKPLLEDEFPSWVLRLDSWKWVDPQLYRGSSKADDGVMPPVIHPVKDERCLSVTGLLVDEVGVLAPMYERRYVGDPRDEQMEFQGIIRDCVWMADYLYSVYSWALQSLPECSSQTLANQFLQAWMITYNFTFSPLEDKDYKYRRALFDILESESRKRGLENVCLNESAPVEPFSVEEACRASLKKAHMDEFTRKMFSMFSNGNADLLPPSRDEVQHPFIVDFCHALRMTAPRFRFFATKDGRLGIGPPSMRTGDKICIIYGEGLPAILRPEGNHWTWVGFAYLETLADGSYVRNLKEAGLLDKSNQVFDLR